MKYESHELQQRLAQDYVSGLMVGAARKRFEKLIEQNSDVQRAVNRWQEALVPLDLDAPAAAPPAEIREALARKIAPPEPLLASSWWQKLNLWRGLALVNGIAALALVALLMLPFSTPTAPPSDLVYVGVLTDADEKPGVAILAYNQPFRLELISKTPLSALPDTELRLWIRDRESGAPVFVGAIPAGATEFPISEDSWAILKQARALIITREAVSSKPLQPKGETLYEGLCINIKKWAEQQ